MRAQQEEEAEEEEEADKHLGVDSSSQDSSLNPTNSYSTPKPLISLPSSHTTKQTICCVRFCQNRPSLNYTRYQMKGRGLDFFKPTHLLRDWPGICETCHFSHHYQLRGQGE
jgi:hypothetical protein